MRLLDGAVGAIACALVCVASVSCTTPEATPETNVETAAPPPPPPPAPPAPAVTAAAGQLPAAKPSPAGPVDGPSVAGDELAKAPADSTTPAVKDVAAAKPKAEPRPPRKCRALTRRCMGDEAWERYQKQRKNRKPQPVEPEVRTKMKGRVKYGAGRRVAGSGQFDMQVMTRNIKRRLRAVQVCYEKELRRDSKLGGGELTVRMTVEPTGKMGDVEVTSSTAKQKPIAVCIEKWVKRFRFNPGPDGGSVTYAYPLSFESREVVLPPRGPKKPLGALRFR